MVTGNELGSDARVVESEAAYLVIIIQNFHSHASNFGKSLDFGNAKGLV
jgi:hypothetical protein